MIFVVAKLLRLQLAFPVEIVGPGIVQVVGQEAPPLSRSSLTLAPVQGRVDKSRPGPHVSSMGTAIPHSGSGPSVASLKLVRDATWPPIPPLPTIHRSRGARLSRHGPVSQRFPSAARPDRSR